MNKIKSFLFIAIILNIIAVFSNNMIQKAEAMTDTELNNYNIFVDATVNNDFSYYKDGKRYLFTYTQYYKIADITTYIPKNNTGAIIKFTNGTYGFTNSYTSTAYLGIEDFKNNYNIYENPEYYDLVLNGKNVHFQLNDNLSNGVNISNGIVYIRLGSGPCYGFPDTDNPYKYPSIIDQLNTHKTVYHRGGKYLIPMQKDTLIQFMTVDDFKNQLESIDNKVQEVTKGLTNEDDKIKAIYKRIYTNIKYDYEAFQTTKSPLENPTEVQQKMLLSSDYGTSTYKEGKGVCIGYSRLFKIMLQFAGIESELKFGPVHNPESNGLLHVWNQIGNYYYDVTWGKDDMVWYKLPKELMYLNRTEGTRTTSTANLFTEYSKEWISKVCSYSNGDSIAGIFSYCANVDYIKKHVKKYTEIPDNNGVVLENGSKYVFKSYATVDDYHMLYITTKLDLGNELLIKRADGTYIISAGGFQAVSVDTPITNSNSGNTNTGSQNSINNPVADSQVDNVNTTLTNPQQNVSKKKKNIVKNKKQVALKILSEKQKLRIINKVSGFSNERINLIIGKIDKLLLKNSLSTNNRNTYEDIKIILKEVAGS